MSCIAVIDFETTGLSPAMGDRATAVAIVLVDYHRPPEAGRAHWAMTDAEMAASLLGQIQHDLRTRHRIASADHALLMVLPRCARPAIGAVKAKYSAT